MNLEEWQEQDIDALAEEGAEDAEKRFSITDDIVADWALKKIAEIEEDYDRQIDLAQEWATYYEERAKTLDEKRERRVSFLRSKLEEYFWTVKHRKTKAGAEKYDLLSGRLSYKPESRKIAWTDDEKLIEHLKASGQSRFIRTKESVDKAGLKKKLEIIGDDVVDSQSGEVVDGCSVEVVPAAFKVEV